MRRPRDDQEDDHTVTYDSRTQAKQAAQDTQDLADALLKLTPAELEGVDMPEALRDAFAEYHAISGFEARRRQSKYVGKLMRQADPDTLRAALSESLARQAQEGRAQKIIEQWRERLMADDSALTEWAAAHPGTVTPALRALIRDARRESVAATSGDAYARKGRAFRALFRALRDTAQTP